MLGEGDRRTRSLRTATPATHRIEDDEGLLHSSSVAQVGRWRARPRFDDEALRFRASGDAAHVLLHDGDRRWRYTRVPAYRPTLDDAGGGGDRVLAPMPGRIVLVKVAAGDAVSEGQELLVMEAMKMELSLRAPRAGIISEMCAVAGDFVEGEAILVLLHTEQ